MDSIWTRLRFGNDGTTVGKTARPVAAVIDALENGETWSQVGMRLSLEPLDLLAAVAVGLLGNDDGLGVELTQTSPARPKLRGALSEPGLRAIAPEATRADRLVLSAGLLQIADFWDLSHEAAQAAEDLGEREFSAYWHGVAHRREPDPGNAAYWFRRVGRHSLFVPLNEAARTIVAQYADKPAHAPLGRGGSWDAMEFIGYCTRARSGTLDQALARRLQRLEMRMLLDATVARVLPKE